jgi:tripeptide aminopeptidase
MGLPCPNLGTGSFNHHGRLEVASVSEMDQVTRLLVDIAAAYADVERKEEKQAE